MSLGGDKIGERGGRNNHWECNKPGTATINCQLVRKENLVTKEKEHMIEIIEFLRKDCLLGDISQSGLSGAQLEEEVGALKETTVDKPSAPQEVMRDE